MLRSEAIAMAAAISTASTAWCAVPINELLVCQFAVRHKFIVFTALLLRALFVYRSMISSIRIVRVNRCLDRVCLELSQQLGHACTQLLIISTKRRVRQVVNDNIRNCAAVLNQPLSVQSKYCADAIPHRVQG